MDWTTVYDFGNEGIRIKNMLIPIAFMIIGFGIAAFNVFNTLMKGKKKVSNIVFGVIFGTFALFFAVVTIFHNISSYYKTKDNYESKRFHGTIHFIQLDVTVSFYVIRL